MLRRHESTHSWKALALAIAVHIGLLGAMLVSFNWKAAHPVPNVTEVELWDKLPAKKSAPVITPEQKPEPKPFPKIEFKPEETKTKEIKAEDIRVEDPKLDIILEKKKKEPELKPITPEKPVLKKDIEKEKKEMQEKLAQAMREEDLKEKQDKQALKKEANALQKLKEDLLSQDGEAKTDVKAKASSAANAGVIGEYKAKIQAKIRGNVNKTLCEDIYAEPRFNITLLPTGDITGTPTLTKTSGSTACDEAVERAIRVSQPLPMPNDPDLYASFRNLNLTFKPNE